MQAERKLEEIETESTQTGQLEERKLKEIEHSRVRRKILQGFERQADTNVLEEAKNLESLVKDKEAFKYHFANIKYYSIAKASEQYQYEWLRKNSCKGKEVLDFGCGNGENGIFAAQCGANVRGIDISPEGVENSNKNAQEAGVADRCKFQTMDGENMTFADNSFDHAVEYGVLHHVDLDKSMKELARVIKPSGSMVCVEALRHNPLIHWYRKRTPHLRTEWEVDHILRVQDLDTARKYFNKVEVKFFHLSVLGVVPFRKTKLFKPLRAICDVIDSVLLKWPPIGKFGWIMIFVVSEPKK